MLYCSPRPGSSWRLPQEARVGGPQQELACVCQPAPRCTAYRASGMTLGKEKEDPQYSTDPGWLYRHMHVHSSLVILTFWILVVGRFAAAAFSHTTEQ